MIDFLWNLSSFVIALGILVTVHEFGHFWVARKNGVKVERFSVGFGKPLWQKTSAEGTQYVLAMIPLGGYVKMLDERVDKVLPEDKDKTLNCKTVYQRIAIVAAGPLANFAFALVALYFMFLIGVPSIKPIVGDIIDGSIANNAGLSQGTQIVSVAGNSTRDWQEVNLALIGQIGYDDIVIETRSKGINYISTFTLDTKSWQFSPDKVSPLTSLGIRPYKPKVYNELSLVAAGSPAEIAGLKSGDKPVSVDGVLVKNWQDFTEQIKRFPNKNVTLVIQRDENKLILVIKPQSIEQNNRQVGYIGVAPKYEPWPPSSLIELSYGPIESIYESAQRTWNLTSLTFGMIGKLIIGDISIKNLSGPIGIAQGAGNSASNGFVYFLSFLALISINLGIINLLPLPVLDGGHLVYYFIELVTGKEVSESTQVVGYKFGALILLSLMAVGLFNDFSRVLG
jgi:regulator of sigma E protease